MLGSHLLNKYTINKFPKLILKLFPRPPQRFMFFFLSLSHFISFSFSYQTNHMSSIPFVAISPHISLPWNSHLDIAESYLETRIYLFLYVSLPIKEIPD